MKKVTFGLIVICFQVAIACLFFMTLLNNKVSIQKYETIVDNENLDKIATSVSLLFKEAEEKEMVLVPDLTTKELPSLDIVEDKKDEINEENDKKNDDEITSQPLVSIDASKYINNESMGFVVTEDNKQYSLNDYEFNVVVAVVAGEFDKNLNDALGVVSVILNRCDSSKWASWAGSTPYLQVIKAGQFEVYGGGYYLDFMPGGVKFESDKYKIAKQAVIDGMNGIRNNSYLGFRAWWISSYSDKYIITGGNRYGFN